MLNRLAVLGVSLETVTRVYSGKPGCGCGCLGKYYEDDRNFKRVLNWMKRCAKDTSVSGRRMGVQDLGDGEFCAFVEMDNRYLWAYFTKEV